MFDIGFWEICLIGVIALIVVGPDRFPGMIRTAGYWMGRFRQIASNVKNEIQTEVDKAEHLKQLMSEQENLLKKQLDAQLDEHAGISPAAQKAAQSNNQIAKDVQTSIEPQPKTDTQKPEGEQKPNG
jgi:sec-independent protein translocase protein TatB